MTSKIKEFVLDADGGNSQYRFPNAGQLLLDSVEQQLAGIWETVLGVTPIGIQDKFFDLGGHSLLAVRLVAKIEQQFGRKLRLSTIFQAPTIQELSPILRDEINESSITGKSSIVEIQARGSKKPLFLVHGAG